MRADSGDHPSLPWSLSEARTWLLAVVAGAALLIFAWWQSSGTGKLNEQVAWGNLAMLGVIVLAVGNVVWVTAGRRAVRARRNEVIARLTLLLPEELPVADSAAPDLLTYVVIAGTDRYHRPDCLLAAGKPSRTPTAKSIQGGRVRACEMCEP